MITDFTSVKRVKLNFEQPHFAIAFTTIEQIINVYPLYALVNIQGVVFNLKEQEPTVREGK